MIFNKHPELDNKHAFMGASKSSWLTKDPDGFREAYLNSFAQAKGTAVHALAHDCIVSHTTLTLADTHLVDICMYKAFIPVQAYSSSNILLTLVPFVNDAIGFHMLSEVHLFYNWYCYGTTDAILFDDHSKQLRIHDLKTGTLPAHMEQLVIYAALFCLEYHKDPKDFTTLLQIYQEGNIVKYSPNCKEIKTVMNTIERNTKIIDDLIKGGLK